MFDTGRGLTMTLYTSQHNLRMLSSTNLYYYDRFFCSRPRGCSSGTDALVFSAITVDGERCVFPFVYKGDVYTSCTTKGDDVAWCSVEPVMIVGSGDWGYCDPVNCAPGTTPPAVETTPTEPSTPPTECGPDNSE